MYVFCVCMCSVSVTYMCSVSVQACMPYVQCGDRRTITDVGSLSNPQSLGLATSAFTCESSCRPLLVIKKCQGQRAAAALGSDPYEPVQPSLWTTGKDSSCHSKADTFSRSLPDGLHSLRAGTVSYACVALATHRAWPLLSVNWCLHQLAWHKQRHGLTAQFHPVSPPSTGLAGAQALGGGAPQALQSFGSHHCHSVPQGNPSTSFFYKLEVTELHGLWDEIMHI